MPKLKYFAAASPLIAGAGTVLGAFIQAHKYKLRRRTILVPDGISFDPDEVTDVPVLKPEERAHALRILHISDPHLLARQYRRAGFIRELDVQNPDLIVLTGDLISEAEAIPPLLEALAAFSNIPGVFVFGSNDYFAPKLKSPLKYFRKNREIKQNAESFKTLPTAELISGLENFGWINLNNSRAALELGSWEINFVGVDDPHIQRDKFPPKSVRKKAEKNTSNTSQSTPSSSQKLNPTKQEELRSRIQIGLTHAPYKRVLDQLQNDGCHLVFAGHTHGGQICLPGHRSLVTNCDLPTSHGSGLFRWPIVKEAKTNKSCTQNSPIHGDGAVIGWDSTSQNEQMWVQISAGLGTSPFTPFRIFCAPEVVQLEIIRI